MKRAISVAKDFTRFPGGRYLKDGPFPGEKFRDEILIPALQNSERVAVQLDGTFGYGSSFLEEVFGGLVREKGFTVAELRTRLLIEASDTSLVKEVWGYIEDAGR